jgi:hypothetical protein
MDRAYVNIYSSGVLCFTVPADGDALSLLSIEPQWRLTSFRQSWYKYHIPRTSHVRPIAVNRSSSGNQSNSLVFIDVDIDVDIDIDWLIDFNDE